MAYVFLGLGVLFGVTGQVFVKMSKGFKVKKPTICAFIAFIVCIYFISLAIKELEVGMVFAIWAGLTIVCTTVFGIIYFGESKSIHKIISILSIIIGVIILKMV